MTRKIEDFVWTFCDSMPPEDFILTNIRILIQNTSFWHYEELNITQL
jgi:hypothetical protein